MSTAAHSIGQLGDLQNPNVVKVVLDARHTALYFSRSPIPAGRDFAGKAWWETGSTLPKPLRHVGIYGYRVGFLREFPRLPQAPLEQLEQLEQLKVCCGASQDRAKSEPPLQQRERTPQGSRWSTFSLLFSLHSRERAAYLLSHQRTDRYATETSLLTTDSECKLYRQLSTHSCH